MEIKAAKYIHKCTWNKLQPTQNVDKLYIYSRWWSIGKKSTFFVLGYLVLDNITSFYNFGKMACTHA